jgi:hypothetical protein
MNVLQRFTSWLLKPYLDALRAEMYAEVVTLQTQITQSQTEFAAQVARETDLRVKSSDLQIRKDIYAELKRVGIAIGELQNRVVFRTTPDDLTSLGERLTAIEQALAVAAEPRKPGNHIEAGHEFGNKVRW